jgi:hypothetical protein
MQDQVGGTNSRTPEKKRTIFSTEPIVDAASAKKAAKHGAIAGLFFAGMYVVGVVFAYSGRSPMDGAAIEDEMTIYGMLIADVLLVALILFLCWRIKTGRGWISSVVLLVWFVVEAAFKIVGGSSNVGWIIFYIAMTMGFVEGVRGTWACRDFAKQANSPSAAPRHHKTCLTRLRISHQPARIFPEILLPVLSAALRVPHVGGLAILCRYFALVVEHENVRLVLQVADNQVFPGDSWRGPEHDIADAVLVLRASGALSAFRRQASERCLSYEGRRSCFRSSHAGSYVAA